jgi:hypothetical protein
LGKQLGWELVVGQATDGSWVKYAVAVRDGEDLLVLITVKRGPRGDVYVNIPRPLIHDWKPHSSYHASGQGHKKSFDRKFDVRHRQPPDQNFRGTEALEHLVITPGGHRAINLPCQLSEFDDVFEIPHCDLPKDHGRLCVDLVEPGHGPLIPFPGARLICQWSFKDAVPWILVSL